MPFNKGEDLSWNDALLMLNDRSQRALVAQTHQAPAAGRPKKPEDLLLPLGCFFMFIICSLVECLGIYGFVKLIFNLAFIAITISIFIVGNRPGTSKDYWLFSTLFFLSCSLIGFLGIYGFVKLLFCLAFFAIMIIIIILGDR